MSEIGDNNYLSQSSPEEQERKRKADPVNYINEAVLSKKLCFEHNDALTARFMELFKENMCFVKYNTTRFFTKGILRTLSFLPEAVKNDEIDKFKIPFVNWQNFIKKEIEDIPSRNIVFSKFEHLSSDSNCMDLIDTAYKYNESSDIPKDVFTNINNRRLYNYLTDKSRCPRLADDAKTFVRNYEDNIKRERKKLFESAHKFHIDRVKSLSTEQHAIIVRLFEMVFGPCSRSHKRMCNCYKFRTSVPIMRIEGKAGSGKTSIMFVVNGLVQYSSKYSLTYLTPTNVLLNSIREGAGVDEINVKTVFSFISKAIRCKYDELCKFFTYTSAISDDKFDSSFLENLNVEAFGCALKKFHIIVVDEIFMFSEGLLTFFLLLMRAFQRICKKVTFIVILIGDTNQLRVYYGPVTDDVNKYKWLDSYSLPVYMSEQFRYSADYNSIMEKLLETLDAQGDEFIRFLKDTWPSKFNSVVKYNYPIEQVLDLFNCIKAKGWTNEDVNEMIEKFTQLDIFKSV